jgi:hypothetical protein
MAQAFMLAQKMFFPAVRPVINNPGEYLILDIWNLLAILELV